MDTSYLYELPAGVEQDFSLTWPGSPYLHGYFFPSCMKFGGCRVKNGGCGIKSEE